MEKRKKDTLVNRVKGIKNMFARSGFIVSTVTADNYFAPLEVLHSGLDAILNVVGWNEHVSEVERHIRTPKERRRSVFSSLPVKRLLSRMMLELVYAMKF